MTDLESAGWYGSYIALHVLLHRADGKVLFLRRADTGYRGGWLAPPAGRIEPGEDVLTAAIREAKEEVGVTLRADDAEFSHIMHRAATASRHHATPSATTGSPGGTGPGPRTSPSRTRRARRGGSPRPRRRPM